MCCTSFSKVSILFSSSSLVAIFWGDKLLDIYTIKKSNLLPMANDQQVLDPIDGHNLSR